MEFENLKAIYTSNLFLPDHEYLDILFATILANRFDGDPVWMFVVGAPGSCKTEILRSLVCEETYHTSKIKSASMISGYVENINDKSKKNKTDHSFLPKIHKKVLIIKDFSTILSMRRDERGEVFSSLRDCYDGYASIPFGTGEKSHSAKFGLIAAITPAIDNFRSLGASLGERFLYVKPNIGDKRTLCMAAVNGIANKTSIRNALQAAAAAYLDNEVFCMGGLTDKEKFEIVELADTAAALRSYVDRSDYRDPYNITSPPIVEVATRISQQIMKITYSLKHMGSSYMKLTKRILRDCVPINRRLVCEHISNGAGIDDIAKRCRISPKSIRIVMADLENLDLIVSSRLQHNKLKYEPSTGIKQLFNHDCT